LAYFRSDARPGERPVAHGAVVLVGHDRAVVWGRALLPVRGQSLPLLRSDVRVTDWSDLAAMGLPGGCWLIRCGSAVAGGGSLTRLGQCPPGVMARIERSIRREAEARAGEGSLERKEGVSAKSAGAILAAGARNAGAKAKRANPRLGRVKGKPGR